MRKRGTYSGRGNLSNSNSNRQNKAVFKDDISKLCYSLQRIFKNLRPVPVTSKIQFGKQY